MPRTQATTEDVLAEISKIRRALRRAPAHQRAGNRQLMRNTERMVEKRIAQLEAVLKQMDRIREETTSQAQLLRLMLDEVKDLTRRKRRAS